MNRRVKTKERLLAQYLLSATLADIDTLTSRRSRTSKWRCPSCGGTRATKR